MISKKIVYIIELIRKRALANVELLFEKKRNAGLTSTWLNIKYFDCCYFLGKYVDRLWISKALKIQM